MVSLAQLKSKCQDLKSKYFQRRGTWMLLRKVQTILSLTILLSSTQTLATYSIVGSNSANKQVGIAITSCVKDTPLTVAVGSVPGKGIIVAQAQPNLLGRIWGQVALFFGAPTDSILPKITSSSFDVQNVSRQYGLVDVNGFAASYTGSQADQQTGERQGRVSTFTYSAQGNTLTGSDVIENAANAFESTGCDLAEKLLLALEAGANGGGGDNRCTSSGRPSSRALLQVDSPNGPAGKYLFFETGYTAGNPLVPLRQAYEKWRLKNPCPSR
jgi:uncharacterized Ntn-hydrolase superfamily protein